MSLLLVDLSNNNPTPDFDALRRAGVWGLWHKVTEGESFKDVEWPRRATLARRAGLHVGGYHFARPTLDDGATQAHAFLRWLGPLARRDLRPVLDLENSSQLDAGELARWVRSFNEVVVNVLGVGPLLYSSPYFIANRLRGLREPLGYGLWLAEYGPDDGREHPAHVPAPWRRCVAHQYTSHGRLPGRLPGIANAVDLSSAPRRLPLLAHGARGLL